MICNDILSDSFAFSPSSSFQILNATHAKGSTIILTHSCYSIFLNGLRSTTEVDAAKSQIDEIIMNEAPCWLLTVADEKLIVNEAVCR